MTKLKFTYFIVALLIIGCSKNEDSKPNSSSANAIESSQIDSEKNRLQESQKMLISQLEKLKYIPLSVAGTKESEVYLESLNELNENWEINNGTNKIGIIEIKDWECGIHDAMILNAAGGVGQLKQDRFQCSIPGFRYVLPNDNSKKYVNVMMTLTFDSIPELSVYKNDRFKFSGRIEFFNASIMIGSVYMVNIIVKTDSIEKL